MSRWLTGEIVGMPSTGDQSGQGGDATRRVGRAPRRSVADTGTVFERFTDRSVQVVVLAQEEARRLDHNYIGTEHLLLGLIREPHGVAAQALGSLGVTLEVVRGRVEELVGPGGSSPSGHMPFSPRAKHVLELSLREAVQLGHNFIGTEHILLGLIREGDCVAAQVLVTLGVDPSEVRQEVIQLLQNQASPGDQASGTATATATLTEAASAGPPRGRAPKPREDLFLDLLQAGEDMRALTLEALVALWDGDLERLREHLGGLVRLASLAGDSDQLARLGHLVEIDDASTAAVRLRPKP